MEVTIKKPRVDDGLIERIEQVGNTLADMVIRKEGDYTEFAGYEGTPYSRTICDHPNLTVAVGNIKAGTTLPSHHHEEWQLVLVVDGEITALADGGERAVPQKDFCVFDPGEPHGFYANVDSVVLLATIPRDRAFGRER